MVSLTEVTSGQRPEEGQREPGTMCIGSKQKRGPVRPGQEWTQRAEKGENRE